MSAFNRNRGRAAIAEPELAPPALAELPPSVNGNGHARGEILPRRGATAANTICFAHITGWGMKVPDQIVTNADLEAIVDTTDDWIRSRTGIQERRIVTERDTLVGLAFEAARSALEEADLTPKDLDLIVVATSTAEDAYPSTASKIQNMLGATRAGAFDLSAACSGFVYALNMAAQAIRSRSAVCALVIGAEVNSRVIDWNDRATCVLFGDGAGAVVLEASDDPGGLLSCVLGSDGSGGDLLGIPSAGRATIPEGWNLNKLHMDGREVFRFAVHILQESIREAIANANLTLADIALIVPHQANQRILSAAARGLNIPEAMFYSNLHRYGNTSAASIPIALYEAARDGRLQPDDRVVIVGFGGGLTWGAAVVHWQALPQSERRGLGRRIAREVQYASAFWRDRAMRTYRRATAKMRGSPARLANIKEPAKDAKKERGRGR
jgi:3-oxoacyl-[acyl-carrier-protein] synthase III